MKQPECSRRAGRPPGPSSAIHQSTAVCSPRSGHVQMRVHCVSVRTHAWPRRSVTHTCPMPWLHSEFPEPGIRKRRQQDGKQDDGTQHRSGPHLNSPHQFAALRVHSCVIHPDYSWPCHFCPCRIGSRGHIRSCRFSRFTSGQAAQSQHASDHRLARRPAG